MSFLAEIGYSDLLRLRKIVRKVHMAYHPERLCTDTEADRLIAALGPETCEIILKKAIDERLIA